MAVSVLQKVLEKMDEDAMVRHEAAEALGAIGTEECEGLLKRFLSDEVAVVVETCQVALDLIKWRREHAVQEGSNASPYSSVDPAPPLKVILV